MIIPSEEITKERARIKAIIETEITKAFDANRIHFEGDHLTPPSRLKNLIGQILFKIDTPDYVRKTK